MALGDIMDTAVLTGTLIEANPAREMGHWLGAGPIRVVLMPSDDAAVAGGLAKELVVPEPHGAAQQLTSGNRERRMP